MGEVEAKLVALRYSEPEPGSSGWTIGFLEGIIAGFIPVKSATIPSKPPCPADKSVDKTRGNLIYSTPKA